MNSIPRSTLSVVGLASFAVVLLCTQTQAADARPYEIAVTSLAPLNTDLFIADADGSKARPLFAHPELDYNGSFSRDGQWIVFTSQRNGSADIFRAHPDESNLQPLVEHPSFDDQAALSPDGAWLAFVSTRSGQADLWILNLRTIYSSPEKNALAPDWSPNGEWIAFALGQFFQTTPNGQSTADIAVIRGDGSELRIITGGKANAGFPSWSGDGKYLVYRETANGKNSLKVIELGTGKSRVLIAGEAHYNFPAWSPTRDLIAFTADIEGDYEVYTVKSDGTNLKRLTKSPGNDAHNSWSRDGEWIAFTTARTGFKDESLLHVGNPQSYGEIAVMRFDGSDVRVLTDNQFEEGTPAWRPRQ